MTLSRERFKKLELFESSGRTDFQNIGPVRVRPSVKKKVKNPMYVWAFADIQQKNKKIIRKNSKFRIFVLRSCPDLLHVCYLAMYKGLTEIQKFSPTSNSEPKKTSSIGIIFENLKDTRLPGHIYQVTYFCRSTIRLDLMVTTSTAPSVLWFL